MHAKEGLSKNLNPGSHIGLVYTSSLVLVNSSWISIGSEQMDAHQTTSECKLSDNTTKRNSDCVTNIRRVKCLWTDTILKQRNRALLKARPLLDKHL